MKYTLLNHDKEILDCEVNEETGQMEQLYEHYDLNYLPPGLVRNQIPDKKFLNRWWLERSYSLLGGDKRKKCKKNVIYNR